ncbi:MAG: heme exporter protein CcmD [Pseudomonadota bacterium]
MPEFDKNASYIWAIVIIGVGVPILLSAYAALRARMARARLERLQSQEDDA